MIATIIGVAIAFIFLWIQSKGNGMRDDVKKLMKEEEDPEKFAEWAFGADYDNLSAFTLAKRWNLLHGKEYMLDLERAGGPAHDIPRMIELWRSSIN